MMNMMNKKNNIEKILTELFSNDSARKKKAEEKKSFYKKLNQELLKFMFLLFSFAIIITFSGYAGYGFLHYMQGINLMSSPIILMQSYICAALLAFIMTLWFSSLYDNAFNKEES